MTAKKRSVVIHVAISADLHRKLKERCVSFAEKYGPNELRITLSDIVRALLLKGIREDENA